MILGVAICDAGHLSLEHVSYNQNSPSMPLITIAPFKIPIIAPI